MIIGSYIGSLNEKRRVALPKRFLNELGDRPIIAKWYEDCLIVVGSDFWGKLIERLSGGKKAVTFGVREIERFILGSAFELEPDAQGRVVIPEVLCNFAGLEEEIVFVGLIDRVEIWPLKTWETKSKEIAKTTKDYIESL